MFADLNDIAQGWMKKENGFLYIFTTSGAEEIVQKWTLQ